LAGPSHVTFTWIAPLTAIGVAIHASGWRRDGVQQARDFARNPLQCIRDSAAAALPSSTCTPAEPIRSPRIAIAGASAARSPTDAPCTRQAEIAGGAL